MKLSDTQRAILTAAAQHPDHLAYPPGSAAGRRPPEGGAGAAEERPGDRGAPPRLRPHAKWTVEGEEMLLRITDAGLRAIGIDPNAGAAAEEDEQSPAAIARRNAERFAAAEAAATGPRRRPLAGRTPRRRVRTPRAGARPGRAHGAGRGRDPRRRTTAPGTSGSGWTRR